MSKMKAWDFVPEKPVKFPLLLFSLKREKKERERMMAERRT